MTLKKYILLLILPAIITGSCSRNESDKKNHLTDKTISPITLETDTVIYDVIIKDPALDYSYVDNSRLNNKRLIDNLFKGVYQKKYTAYDFGTENVIPVRQLRELEESGEIKRESIGKLQFTELWQYNIKSGKLSKEILGVTLAYEVYRDDSTMKFYRPLFKIKYK